MCVGGSALGGFEVILLIFLCKSFPVSYYIVCGDMRLLNDIQSIIFINDKVGCSKSHS